MKLLTSIAMLFFCSYNALLGQDTTPPVITMQPTGQSYTCETDNIVELLTTWFNNNGGTQATDDSGTVMINAPLMSLSSRFTCELDHSWIPSMIRL